jgi:hypothetical protein
MPLSRLLNRHALIVPLSYRAMPEVIMENQSVPGFFLLSMIRVTYGFGRPSRIVKVLELTPSYNVNPSSLPIQRNP